MSDQTPAVGGSEASLSPEIADYFGVDQASAKNSEKVASNGQEKKQADADKTKENDSEGKKPEDAKSDDSKATEDKKTTETKKEDGEDKTKDDKKSEEDAQPTEFEVAGKKYSTLAEAVKAVNRISGDNTRISGDLKSLRKEKTDLESKVEGLEKLLSDYKEANEKWQKYYEEGGDKPDETKVNLEEIIEKKLEEREKRKEQSKTKQQFNDELDEIFKEEDFNEVQPFFKELVDEFDGVPKVSPKKLYERARNNLKLSKGSNELKDIESIDKMVDERVQKELAKREAAKANPASGGSSPKESVKLSPEVADALRDVI